VGKVKNIKISEYHHKLLKEYCEENGIKIYRFIEKIIEEKCEEKKDLYGE
jgi:hypothetical protein